MNNIQTGAGMYQQTAIQSMPPDKLLIMVYDGAIRCLKLAKEALDNKEFEAANKHLLKTQDFITELMVTLDMSYPIAGNLYKLYDYFRFRLVQANVRKDVEPVAEVLGHLVSLREVWIQAAQAAKKTSPAGGLDFAG